MGRIGLLFPKDDSIGRMRNDRWFKANLTAGTHIFLEIRVTEAGFEVIIPAVDDVAPWYTIGRILIGVGNASLGIGRPVGRAPQQFQIPVIRSEFCRPPLDR